MQLGEQNEADGEDADLPTVTGHIPPKSEARSKAASGPKAAAARKRGKRSRQARGRLVIFFNFLMTLLILSVVGAGVLFYFGKSMFNEPGPSADFADFTVKPGTGIAEIANGLAQRGLISDGRVFRYAVRAYGYDHALRAGEYQIRPHASMHDIMDMMHEGKVVLYSITVPEGVTVAEVMKRVAADPVLTGDMPDQAPPEGSLFANTERFGRGTTREEIIQKMMADQRKLVQEIWSRRDPDLPLKDVNQFVTLASIVEKETGKLDERPRVAAVFLNRLKKGMRLQSDPTVIYGLFGGEGKPPDRPLYQFDLDKPTPYNTYLVNGLPPTPIANPGRAALEAVANPAKTDDLYFVADGSGGHVFAATLQEHNANVKRWRELEQQRKDDAAAAAAASGAGNGAAGGGAAAPSAGN